LPDARMIKSCHGRDEFHELWISFESIHTLTLVTKTAGLCINDDQWSILLSPLDSAANSRFRLR